MIGPIDVMNLIFTLPINGASEQPCHAVNPDLWEVWCKAKGRTCEDPTNVWSEIDVASSAELMVRQFMRNRITGDRAE